MGEHVSTYSLSLRRRSRLNFNMVDRAELSLPRTRTDLAHLASVASWHVVVRRHRHAEHLSIMPGTSDQTDTGWPIVGAPARRVGLCRRGAARGSRSPRVRAGLDGGFVLRQRVGALAWRRGGGGG